MSGLIMTFALIFAVLLAVSVVVDFHVPPRRRRL